MQKENNHPSIQPEGKAGKLPKHHYSCTIVSSDARHLTFRKILLNQSSSQLFSMQCNTRNKENAHCCLEMIKFAMANTLVQFHEDYWEYIGAGDVYKKELMMSDLNQHSCRPRSSIANWKQCETHDRSNVWWYLLWSWHLCVQPKDVDKRDCIRTKLFLIYHLWIDQSQQFAVHG